MKFLFLSINKMIVPGSIVVIVLAVVIDFWGVLVVGAIMIEIFC